MDMDDFRVATVPMLFKVSEEEHQLENAIDKLCKDAESRIDSGDSLIILSDRGVDQEHAAIPALLAVSAVHHYLVRQGKRHLAGLIIESGEVRSVHHFATLVGYGASGINPYLVFEALSDLKQRGYLPDDLTLPQAVEHYVTAVKKGLLKIMSKMGVSTIRSYRGSQIYEAIGLSKGLIDKYFSGTASRVGGIDINVIEHDVLSRHRKAWEAKDVYSHRLQSSGEFSSRKNADKHLFSAEAVVNMQKAVRTGDYKTFKKYTAGINDISKNLNTLRGLFRFKKGTPVPLEEVEPASEIVKRFVSSAMSFGSMSREVHETMAIAMNRLGGMSNSGEGGEDMERYTLKDNGDNPMSRV